MATEEPEPQDTSGQPEIFGGNSFAERAFLGRDGRVRPTIRAISFFIVAYLLSTVAAGLAAPYTAGLPSSLQLAIISSVSLGVMLTVTWFFLRSVDHSRWHTLGLSVGRGWLARASEGVGIGFALQAAIALLLIISHAQHYDARSAWNIRVWFTVLIDVWLFSAAATAEELLFRGYALQRLIDAFGAPFAAILSSTVFGLAHIWNPSANLFSTLNTILAGILMSVAYLKTRTMWLPCGLHAAWNFFMGPIFCFPVSGIDFEPRMFVTRISGPAWWTGGSYGPEAGAAGTLVLVAGTAWLLVGLRSPLPTESGQA
ncbi:MAG TPA: type II CAAX endopeptidase family protein [Candidatus Acidoferrales bacterium]|nr:type II CAAX endopeptidase family protein [Candidatus Acidoferrales bacterium]